MTHAMVNGQQIMLRIMLLFSACLEGFNNNPSEWILALLLALAPVTLSRNPRGGKRGRNQAVKLV